MGEQGQHIGPYRLVATLGEGGMGAVYLAREAGGRGRAVAVKVLRPELARDQGMVRRFRREADTASSVRGRGVARLLGYDLDGPLPWIAAEFLAGPTLHEAVGFCGPFDEAGARALGVHLARALTVIHGAGLVHRDLKPSNIVLTRDGPRIIDFGIARPEYGLTLTDPGTAPATPGYAPPEQVTGRRTGPAADVFSLGAVLAFACTGRAPFGAGHPAAVNFRVVHENPDLTGVPSALLGPLGACLAKDSAARPTPERLASVLGKPGDLPWRSGPLHGEIERRTREAERALALARAQDRPPGRPSRRRVLSAATAVVATGGGLTWWLRRGEPEGPRISDSGVPYAEPLANPRPGAVPDALWKADGIHPDGPDPVAVDRVVVAASGGGLAAWRQHTGERAWSWPGNGAPVRHGPLLAADRALFVVTRGGWLTALDARSGAVQWDTREAGAEQALAVDPVHVYVLDRGRRVAAVSPRTRKVRWRSRAPLASTGPVGAAVADGRLLVCTREGQGVAFDVLSGEVRWSEDFGPVKPYVADVGLVPAVHEDAFCVGGDRMVVVDAADGRQRWTQDHDSLAVQRSWGAPAVVDGKLYAPRPALVSRELLCLEVADGSRVWTTDVGYAESEFIKDDLLPVQAVVREGEALYVPLGVDRRGHVDREHDLGVAVLDASSGAKLWVLNDDSAAAGWRLAAAAGRVFVARGTQLRAMPTW
ncbi:PQQ-binding-like beta-propeller repeat protein [Streptomyces sp. YC504]|uniref:PQQ-binding-like beta-propeller repeat protein n=1 Tax=Streptomyces mesophilus TaxID=1775132 RepID=A0A6G4XYH8_9ACTN|nr:serine/threonine-protein kinase [Streptomyces mesophilus]NGO81651.1 PQQ-binding-like beta-propeller repeat protein [Streptomyces mesophilus]